MSEANKTQVGGNHYKTGGIEHWDMMERNGIGYLESAATKYIARRKGSRLEDLQKARHYTQKLLELHLEGVRGPRGAVPIEQISSFCVANNLNSSEDTAVVFLCQWKSQWDLEQAIAAIDRCIARASGDTPGTPEDGGHHALQEDE